MVSIVIVSHSAKLAEGVRELAEQMVGERVILATAGGIDDPENPIGTDAMKVYQAIEEAYSEEGVVVLMDLGSALLSAEMALEFLPPEQQANVHLCEAPLVEGVMAAAVTASIGGTVEQVMAEARGALSAKEEQLRPLFDGQDLSRADEAVAPSRAMDGDWQEQRLLVRNRLGLHARPAARFVKTANQFESEMMVGKESQWASAKSINQVATLGVRQGDEIRIRARGDDSAQALAAIMALADDNFGDLEEPASEPEESAEAPIAPQTEGELTGIGASPGIAIGPVWQYRPQLPEVEVVPADDPEAEWQRLENAIQQAQAEISALYDLARRQVGDEEAAIFEAHLLFLQDPVLVDDARGLLFEQRVNAEAAWQQAIEDVANSYRALDDDYLRARAADVEDVGRRVLTGLMGLERPSLNTDHPMILVATDLTPSDTARLDPAVVLGICTEMGGSTSHSAILSRALGIPAIVGLGPVLATLEDGHVVAMNGEQGRLWTKPTGEQLAELEEKRRLWSLKLQEAKASSRAAAITKDGQRIEVAANIGGPRDAQTALDFGAEGVGLFRTEFLFLDRQDAPTEEEQFEAYRQAALSMGELPLIIRTLDVGGDKPLPYVDLGREDNPFLGWRGIRFCLGHPEVFKPQLRAILRASAGTGIKLMFPMIGTLGELRAARSLLNEARSELAGEGLDFNREMEVGIMIEVPAAVAIADLLAAEVDFFSIGTNDLTQYVMAADRGNSNVAGLANALQPAVLRMVRQTVQAAHRAGIWVGMCGELAGNPAATPLLVGLGLDELSMSAPAIPAVKETIRQWSRADCRVLVEKALELASAGEVEELIINN